MPRPGYGTCGTRLPGASTCWVNVTNAVFRRLGVFVGGFTLEAADAVAGEGADVLASVRALVAASLVNPMEAVGDEPRFTMLETIREFALEQLAAHDEELLIRRRHAEYYQALAESALPHYDGPELRVYRHRVNVELDNCRAAMAWALDNGAAETGVRLAGALWRIWWTGHAAGGKPWTDRVVEGRSWCERMLAIGDHLPVEALTEALIGVGFLATGAEELARMQAAGEEPPCSGADQKTMPMASIGLTRCSGNWPRCKDPTSYSGNMGSVRRRTRKREMTSRDITMKQRWRLPPRSGIRTTMMSLTLTHLGVNAQRGGDLGRSATLLDEALSLCRSTNNPFVLAMTLVPLGQVLREQGPTR